MPKISLSGFKDPVRRPRYIIWSGVVVVALAAVVIVALGATSSYWFCADVCHKVQDDSINAYNASTHSEVSCMSCHMPAGADPITFVLHKAKALGELYLTVTDNFEIPLNAESHLAMDTVHMPSSQCTQCHSENREVTPSEGIIIDHEVHEEAGVTCTMCHNRIAHPDDGIELVNVDPQTGEPAHPHADFMTMDACFRCHGLEDDANAPGACGACHPEDFELKPENHLQPDFYPAGHAELAREEASRVAEAPGGHGEEADEGEEADSAEEADPAEEEGGHGEAGPEFEILGIDQVNYCDTCHKDEFCSDCHGMEMPHPQEFVEETHPELVETSYGKCVMCHAPEAADAEELPEQIDFCDACHHGTKVDWDYDPEVAWTTQHAATVRDTGVQTCLGACHEQQYCIDCHTAQNPVPTSHQAGDWRIIPTRDDLGQHATAARGEITACEICHGEGGATADFCMNCHGLEVPHPGEFTEFHAATGRDNPDVCRQCHTFNELCSDCHHEGAKRDVPWLQVHPQTVADTGADGCFEQCHQDKQFCVTCHNEMNALPTSHQQAGWTKRPTLSDPALHPQAYEEAPVSCTYCHGEGGTEAQFCVNCHQLEMPHPEGYGAEGDGGIHAEKFAADELSRATCTNCHANQFCNSCHHPGSTGQQPWQQEHPGVVAENGADPCFECHEPTYCSYCHVRLISQVPAQE